jgi:hypothetical protein
MRRRTVLSQSGSARLILFNAETGAYYGLDEVGSMVWGLCDGAHSVSEIVNRLFGEYDASVEIILTDLMAFLAEMLDQKLLLARAG